ncbi:MAG TPA: response regulator [Lacipirellulaceae bacterium]|nr:response regulator [Lacipirellulaceae bacterium]
MTNHGVSFSGANAPRILCVDDDPDISENIELRLWQYDVEVVRAFHGMHGLSLATSERPDLIITDLRMPQGSGEFIVKSLRKNPATKGIPIIVFTGRQNHQLEAMATRHSVDAVLSKPIQYKDLVAAIGRFVPLRIRNPHEAANEF